MLLLRQFVVNFYLGFHSNKARKSKNSSSFITVNVNEVQALMRIVFCHSTMQNPWVGNGGDEKILSDELHHRMKSNDNDIFPLPNLMMFMTFSGQTPIILSSEWESLAVINIIETEWIFHHREENSLIKKGKFKKLHLISCPLSWSKGGRNSWYW